jgi:hypothetical protein
MSQPYSLFERVIVRQRPTWVKVSVSLLLLLLPFGIAYLSGIASDIFRNGQWRFFLLSPSIIIYIWLVSPLTDRQSKEVMRSLRAISTLDEESFSTLIEKAQQINPRNEWIAIATGAILGLAINSSNDLGDTVILFQVYWTLSLVAMYAMMVWVIYISAADSRLGGALLRQPLRINIFNPAPFEAIGRQSLLLAMAFVGGITLSLVLSFQVANLAEPLFWLIYLPLVLVTLLIFFLGMRPAHRLLAKQKDHELWGVQRHLERLGQELLVRLDKREETSTIASEINALAIYEHRLQGARTWPYNTGMLRTLFFSVLMPLGPVLIKIVIDIVLE